MTLVAPSPGNTSEGAPQSPATLDQLPDARSVRVMHRWKLVQEDLAKARREYWMNLSFYLGEQWLWWDRHRKIIQQLPQQYSPLGPGRARITVNRMAPNLGSVLGRFLKNQLAFEVLPSAVADDATGGARLSERVLAAYHRKQDWEQLRFDEVLGALLGGTAAISIDWDGQKGKKLTVDPRNHSIVAIGEPCLRSLNISEFGIEPQVRDWRQARWWVQGLALPPETVKSMLGLSWMPRVDVGALATPLQQKLAGDSGRSGGDKLTLILSYYERPNKETPQGEYRVVVNGMTVHSEAWPFPFDDLNLEIFRCRKLPSEWVGTTFVSDAVPIQFAYNHARSVIAEHMKLAGNARLMAPYGAFNEEDLTDDPGSVLFWQPDLGSTPPGYLAPPSLPRWMLEEAANLKAELDDTMFVNDVSRGVGFDRASGQALAVLGEKADSPLAAMVFEQKRGWESIGSKVLQVLGKKAGETREMTLPAAPGIPEVVKWNGSMLRGQYDVQVPLEAVAPRTHASQMAYAKDLWDRQIITDPRQYARMSGLPPEDFGELLDADAASAQRENLRMMAGYPEIPEKFEDHGVHIAEHNRQRKSDSYKFATPDIKKLMDDHIQFHEMLAHEELAKQTQAAAMDPILAMAPQGNAPPGSALPPTAAEQQAAMARQMQGGSGTPALGPGGTSAGVEGLAQMVGAAAPTPAGGGGQGAAPPGA